MAHFIVEADTCPLCEGKGYILMDPREAGDLPPKTPCSNCSGTGMGRVDPTTAKKAVQIPFGGCRGKEWREV